LLEHLQDVNVDVAREQQALQGVDVLEHQRVVLKHRHMAVRECHRSGPRTTDTAVTEYHENTTTHSTSSHP